MQQAAGITTTTTATDPSVQTVKLEQVMVQSQGLVPRALLPLAAILLLGLLRHGAGSELHDRSQDTRSSAELAVYTTHSLPLHTFMSLNPPQGHMAVSDTNYNEGCYP